MSRLVILILATTVLSFAQDKVKEKPRVFPAGKGTLNSMTTSTGVNGWTANARSGSGRTSASGHGWATGLFSTTIDAHDESMELAKDFGKNCPDVTITLSPRSADYMVALNRESTLKRWPMANNQILVANRIGDMVQSGATRSVSNAAKDACGAILADWAQHGKIELPTALVTPEVQPSALRITQDVAANESPDSQKRYIRIVNSNGSVSFIPECKQTATGSCAK
jgi:hypothetical protein